MTIICDRELLEPLRAGFSGPEFSSGAVGDYRYGGYLNTCLTGT